LGGLMAGVLTGPAFGRRAAYLKGLDALPAGAAGKARRRGQSAGRGCSC